MTEIQNPKQKNNRFEPVWNWRFICNLVLGICDFIHKTPRQSHLSLTWPKGPGFSRQNKIMFFMFSYFRDKFLFLYAFVLSG